MNLARLRELTAAGMAGTIRPEELRELFEALPEVLDFALIGSNLHALRSQLEKRAGDCSSSLNEQDDFAGRFGY